MFDEEKIINDILKGNLNTFQLVVKQYQNLVYSILNRMLANNEDIEDIGQEVFIKVYENLKKFKKESKLSTWIARIAYNVTINHLKKENRNHFDDIDDRFEFHSTPENPETKLIGKELTDYLNHLISELPLQYRTVITLYHWDEFSVQEISEITKFPEGTVKGYLFRARKLLKEKLQKDGYQ
ncbi:sigma-70 family RNA polymerase sigma factor [Chryseobacterium sp. MEBOG06]|uniref:RNA polymerase sigma factor n=1 Tax=unclassified Chryseobacterium TaxID=2593645 RepID=UPI001F00DC51|nr:MULTISPECIES: sigma-70 family RNA polymerase sigma factor [unclassified Chryseobacterium]UKB82200.1 sigma-70 family RNA polymerase sigma factor [Chryseobacterium sp. MEBOG06]